MNSCNNNKIEDTIKTPNIDNLSWTSEDAKMFNLSQFDESKWDTKILESELSYVDNEPWLTQPPIEHLTFPVAKYGPGFQGYGTKEIAMEIEDKIIKGGTFAVATNQYSIEPKYDPNRSNIIFFNILVLTDKPESENSALNVSSRNYPHHTCQGTRKTSIGNVDWVAMHLATGTKFALVSTKYFNLEFGQTILVAPQKDGSLRFKQIKLPSISMDEINDEISNLSERADIRAFFLNEKNI